MNDDADKLASGSDDEALLAELKSRLELSMTVNAENHSQGLDDLNFVNGNQWPENVKRERELDGRPCLTINKLPTFVHQVTNDQRQNVPGIKVSAVDEEADVETAQVVQGMIRHIEYNSNADVAYDTAVNCAAQIGFGYFRLVTDYCSPNSFDQDIRFKRIRNPFTVYFDPASEEPDGSDATFVIVTSKMPRHEFKRQWPRAEAANESFVVQRGDGTNKDWLFNDSVRIAEYYRIEMTNATLVQLPDGSGEWKEELEKMGVEIPPDAITRQSARKRIMWYKCTGVDVLERVEIKCDWIPVFPVYGDELDIDGCVTRSGLIRHAKDPAKMYNYWMTSATEEVALRPKVPYIGAAGQFAGFEGDWNQANVRSFPFLEYTPVSIDGVLSPAPQRQPMADIPSGMLSMAMHANDNIKATTGLFDSSLGSLGNARSGVQERQQQRQGDTANFHFADNLNRSVRHAGRCIVSMIPHYYDATRIVRIMGEDGEITSAKINAPLSPEELAAKQQEAQGKPEGERDKAIRSILNDLTVGQYDIVVKAGPSYDTLRQEALDSMVEVAGKWPKLMDIAGDKVIAAMDWPGAEGIAERVALSIPPELRGKEEGAESGPQVVQTPKGPIPMDQVGPMLEEMDQQIQQMGQQLQEASSGIAKAKIDAESRETVAEINAVARSDVAELQGLIQLLIARLAPPPAIVEKALTNGDSEQFDGGDMESQESTPSQPAAQEPQYPEQ